VTSRPALLSTSGAGRTSGCDVTAWPGRTLLKLRQFDDEQVLAFLTNLLGGDERQAGARLELLRDVRDLLGLSRIPRMLGFIAGLDERRLRTARDQHGTITAAVLYGELLEQWLDHEYTRAQPRGAAPTLSHGQRWSAVTKLALRLWESTEPTLAAEDIQEVAAALQDLAERQLDVPGAAHVIGSGTLLVRTDAGRSPSRTARCWSGWSPGTCPGCSASPTRWACRGASCRR